MFSDLFKAIILGAVEGITEFLPISSTGHLIIVNEWLSFSGEFTAMFDVVIQLGAILAVVVLYWKKLWPAGSAKASALDTWKKVIIAVIPALILGALLGELVQEYLFNPIVVAIALIVGGILLLIIEKKRSPWEEVEQERSQFKFFSIAELDYRTAFKIGLIQCLALIPGTSRSAATIIGALWLRANRTVAAEFSFFLAIPTLLAASAYSLLSYESKLSGPDTIILLVGFVVSFIVAWAVIKMFMRYIQHHDFRAFGWYRIVLGLAVLLYFSMR